MERFPRQSLHGSGEVRRVPRPEGGRQSSQAQRRRVRSLARQLALGVCSKVQSERSVVQSLRGSVLDVSKPILATKYSFFSIFRDLQDHHSFAPLQSQKFSQKSSTNLRSSEKCSSRFGENCWNLWNIWRIFAEAFSLERYKGMMIL